VGPWIAHGACGRARDDDDARVGHEVISTLRGEHRSTEVTADGLGIGEASAPAALAYDADVPDEVEQDIEAAAALAREERASWDRQQQARG
jgi:hypothetical protein